MPLPAELVLNVSRGTKAIYPVNLTGNLADSNADPRKPRKKDALPTMQEPVETYIKCHDQ